MVCSPTWVPFILSPSKAKPLQDPQTLESLEGSFSDVADGVVAEAQDTEAAQLGQALLIQPSEVVEGQNPEEEKKKTNVTTELNGCPLLSSSHATTGLTSPGRGYCFQEP